jgi:hypothetical protein
VIDDQSDCAESSSTDGVLGIDVYIRDRDVVPASYSAAKRVQVFLGLVPAGVSSYKSDAGRWAESGTYLAWRDGRIGRIETRQQA